MTAFILRRILSSFLTLIAVITLSFMMMKATPGSPFDKEKDFPPAVKARLNAKYGLDKPIMKQYAIYMGNLSKLDLGLSIKYKNRTVTEILSNGLKISIVLGGTALIFSLIVGILTGVYSAVHQNKWQDYLTGSIVIMGVAIPNFILGPLLVIVFCFSLRWLPVAGWGGFKQLLLPAITLGLIRASYISRLMRAGMVEVLRQDFVRTARSKGLTERAVIWKHAFKPGVLPVLSYLGPATAAVFVGSVVVERIFNIPGLGTFLVNAATNRDMPLALGAVILYTVMLLALNLLVDVLYTFVDPRIEVA